MDTEKNKSVLERVIKEVFNKGDYRILPELYHPDFIEHQYGLHASLAGVQQDVQFLRTKFPDFTLKIEDMVASDDKVWIRMTGTGTNTVGFMGAPNGKSFSITVFDQVRFVDGKIMEHWGSPDRFAMLSQLGLITG